MTAENRFPAKLTIYDDRIHISTLYSVHTSNDDDMRCNFLPENNSRDKSFRTRFKQLFYNGSKRVNYSVRVNSKSFVF